MCIRIYTHKGNYMFKSKKSFALLAVTLTLGASVIAPTISASADSVASDSSKSQLSSNLQSSANLQNNIGGSDTTNDSQLSAAQQQQLQQEIAKQTITTTDSNGNTVESISDSDMLNAVYQVDPKLANEVALTMGPPANGTKGTSKIIWHGKARHGNVDIYISAGMLNFAKKVGINIALTGLLAPLAAIPGAGAAAAVLLVKQVLSGWVVHENHFSDGRVLHFEGFNYKG